MYATVIKKELLDNILNLRYIVTFVLFLVVIVSAVVVRTHLFTQQRAEYQHSLTVTSDMAKKATDPNNAHNGQSLNMMAASASIIQKAPNPLSIFAQGLELEMDRTYAATQGVPISAPRFFSSPRFGFFMQMDMVLVINIICSLLALLLVYDSICGERERGTLKVLLAGPLPRDVLLVGKLIAGWITLMVPLGLSLVVALVYVLVIGKVGFTPAEWTQLLLIFGLSILYITLFFSLGLAASAWANKSATALVVCLFCWILFCLAIPNLVPMVLKHVAPIPPESKIILDKEATRRYVESTLAVKWRAEMSENGQIQNFWDMESQLRERVNTEVNLRTSKTDRFFNSRIQNQIDLNQQWARLSPSAAYLFAATELAGTGVHDYVKYLKYVETNYYKRLMESVEKTNARFEQENRGRRWEERKYVLIPADQLPAFKPPRPDVDMAFNYALFDIAVLSSLTVLLFLGAYVGFMSYKIH